MGVTRADVARLAGVSPSTVTYVLTGARPTRASTRERVRRAVADLGYHPNSHASVLAARSVRTVGALFRLQRESIDLNDLDYVAGVRERLEPEGIHVVVPIPSGDGADGDLLRLVRSRTLDAAVLMDVARDDEREQLLVSEDVPVVLIGTSGSSVTPSVDADFEQMADLVLGHLLALGHRQIVFLTRRIDRERSSSSHAQRRAMEHLARARGVEMLTRPVSGVAVAGADLLVDGHLPRGCTAVVSNNQEALKGLLIAAWSHGIHVPANFSVVSLGQTAPCAPDGRLVTEVGVDRRCVGRRAGQLLLDRLSDSPGAVEHVTMGARLVDHGSVRDISGPRPPGAPGNAESGGLTEVSAESLLRC